MVWQPTSGVGSLPDGGEPRCGTVRPSMKSNPLLARAELGKVKPSMFHTQTEDHVFGYSIPKDPEGAREVTMLWKEHQPSLGADVAAGKTQADFKRMNKEAAKSGLTTAKEQPAFRATHLVTVKKFDHTRKTLPKLPNDADPTHVYGMPSSHRSHDLIRTCGPAEPAIKHLIQGAYQDEWINTNVTKAAGLQQATYIPPVPTRATLGHAIGATRFTQPHYAGEEWKISKFKKVGPKVTQYFGATNRGPNATQAEPRAEATAAH